MIDKNAQVSLGHEALKIVWGAVLFVNSIVTQVHATEDFANLSAIHGDNFDDHLEELSKTGVMTFISGLTNVVGRVIPQAKQYTDYISSKSEQIADTIGTITPHIFSNNTHDAGDRIHEATKAQVTSLFKRRLSSLKEENVTPIEVQEYDNDSSLTL
ncbi:MAG: hypothetical protein PSV35_01585 [bacterium]|nr:hypothetical protein [bacterium]